MYQMIGKIGAVRQRGWECMNEKLKEFNVDFLFNAVLELRTME